jgi:hypothetical protein
MTNNKWKKCKKKNKKTVMGGRSVAEKGIKINHKKSS